MKPPAPRSWLILPELGLVCLDLTLIPRGSGHPHPDLALCNSDQTRNTWVLPHAIQLCATQIPVYTTQTRPFVPRLHLTLTCGILPCISELGLMLSWPHVPTVVHKTTLSPRVPATGQEIWQGSSNYCSHCFPSANFWGPWGTQWATWHGCGLDQKHPWIRHSTLFSNIMSLLGPHMSTFGHLILISVSNKTSDSRSQGFV